MVISEPLTSVILDMPALERGGAVVPPRHRNLVSEEFRRIKQPLLRNRRLQRSLAERMSQVMVTSALPGEGKTFTAINLALSVAAEINQQVLLVDADVVRPEAMQRLGVKAERGLLDLLEEPKLTLNEVVISTNIPNLSLLPAGRARPFSTELLASEGMERLLDTMAMDHPDRIVIFDAPPLLVTSEAQVLASRVGQVLVVVGASSTGREFVAQAFEALASCKQVMTVLNRSRTPRVAKEYGWYYGS